MRSLLPMLNDVKQAAPVETANVDEKGVIKNNRFCCGIHVKNDAGNVEATAVQ